MNNEHLANLKYYFGPQPAKPEIIETDICIYGGHSGGVAAAVQASRMGLTSVIAEFGRHLGGLTSGGLGATDIGNKAAIGGISREFYKSLGKHYGEDEMWTFEPHVAEDIFNEMAREANVPVYFEQCLQAVKKENGRITEIVMENGNVFRAKIFIDASYEGDLMAMAGVSYHVGREANSVYKETINGIHFGSPTHNFIAWVDPYVREGDPSSGLLPGVQDVEPGFQGQGDKSVQAYNFRVCLTSDPDNQIPFPKPPNYDPMRYELFARYLNAGVWDALKLTKLMPNNKTDTNNKGAFSSDNIGVNYEWPDGDYNTREQIFQDHVTYNLGMYYFLANDKRVPKAIQDEVNGWGLPKDEFVETGGWPHQLYIREARRMISDYVAIEQDCRHFRKPDDPVGLAAYTMDSHNCRRIALDGRVINEGNVEIRPTGPYPISYRSIVPRESECTNLLVPFCLSSSHIAFGSIRMEPVFMVLGQSSATAAALAIADNCALQQVKYDELRAQLLKDKQILDWVEPK